jgi:hypothetical protein
MSLNKVATVKTEITGQNGFPTKGTLPTGRTLTGTFSSVGQQVTGTGTLFTEELAGMQGWLYSTTDNELRMFTQINGDTSLWLDKPFTNNQTNEPVIVCSPLYMAISAKSSHPSNDSQINSRKFAAGEVRNYNNDAGINPITYDAASGGSTGEITFDLAY